MSLRGSVVVHSSRIEKPFEVVTGIGERQVTHSRFDVFTHAPKTPFHLRASRNSVVNVLEPDGGRGRREVDRMW